MIISELKLKLRSIKSDVRKRYGVELLGIVGSFARGSNNEQSDLDLASRIIGDVSMFEISNACSTIEDLIGIPIDLVFVEDMKQYKRTHIMKDFQPL